MLIDGRECRIWADFASVRLREKLIHRFRREAKHKLKYLRRLIYVQLARLGLGNYVDCAGNLDTRKLDRGIHLDSFGCIANRCSTFVVEREKCVPYGALGWGNHLVVEQFGSRFQLLTCPKLSSGLYSEHSRRNYAVANHNLVHALTRKELVLLVRVRKLERVN